jgi:hypothetical protein
MSWLSFHDGVLKIGDFAFPIWISIFWLILALSFVAGHIWSPGLGRGSRGRLFSREDDPVNYWTSWIVLLIVTMILTFWRKQLLSVLGW